MLINLNTVMMGIGQVPLSALLPLAPKYGYGAVEFPLWEITTVEQAKEATLKLADKGLEWGLMPMDIDILRECPEEVFTADLETVKRQMDVAQAAGVHRYYNHVWPGSNEREYDENYAWHIDRVTRVYEAARDHDVIFGLEFLGPKPLQASFRYSFMRTLREVLSLVDAVSKEVAIQVDTFHLYTSGSTEDLGLLGSGERVVGVHLNDGWKGRSSDEQQDMERELPLATGVIDSVSVVRTLKEMEYEGPITVEPFEPAGSRLRAMPLEEALKTVADSARQVLTLAGVT